MARNFITYIVWVVILTQRVAIMQLSDMWTSAAFLVMLQIIFVIIILYMRGSRKFDEKRWAKLIAWGLYGVAYYLIFISLIYPFFRANSFDMVLVTMTIVMISNYELMFYRGYENYTADWVKRVLIILPIFIVFYFIIQYTENYFLRNPIIFYEEVELNGEYYTSFRHISANYVTTIKFILYYIVYKLDLLLIIKPIKPETSDFWLHYDGTSRVND